MNDIAIVASGLGKRFRIGGKQKGGTDFRQALTDAVMAPFRRFGRLWHRESASPEDSFWALKDVSFEIRTGEIVGIIGLNGAGKSTLLKVLSRVTSPTLGRAEIHGKMGSLLEVGTGFHPELTGRENIYLNASILGMRRQEVSRKLDQIVDFAAIDKFLDTPVKHYSSGMYVRLAFAVAAHVDADILLLDEVLAVGDTSFQNKCLGRMGDMARSGRTVVLVSHNLPSIANLCQRALFMKDGRIHADGPSSCVVEQYLSSVRTIGGEIVWPTPELAPGTDLVRLHAVRIMQEGIDGPTADVDISKDIHVQLTYWNLREGAMLYPAIWLKDHVGTFVLASANLRSMSLTEDPWAGQAHPRGLFKSVCILPANFLNEGLYSICAILGVDVTNTQVLKDYLLSFRVHDSGGMRKEYMGSWIGPVVRPRLAWNTELLEPHRTTA